MTSCSKVDTKTGRVTELSQVSYNSISTDWKVILFLRFYNELNMSRRAAAGHLRHYRAFRSSNPMVASTYSGYPPAFTWDKIAPRDVDKIVANQGYVPPKPKYTAAEQADATFNSGDPYRLPHARPFDQS